MQNLFLDVFILMNGPVLTWLLDDTGADGTTAGACAFVAPPFPCVGLLGMLLLLLLLLFVLLDALAPPNAFLISSTDGAVSALPTSSFQFCLLPLSIIMAGGCPLL